MISVALPVVKTKFFESALKSILNQTHDNFELIVVNNGSPEDVEGILNKYTDKRIRYIKHESMLPIIENWNKCLSYAKGEYFVLFSDDDIYEKDFLKELNMLSGKYPKVDIFHVRVKVIDENGNTSYYTASCPEFETVADFVWHRLKSYRMHYAPDFMCKTEVLKNMGGFVDFPNAWGSDDATWFLMANKNGIVASSKILCSWRQSQINLSRKESVENKLIAVEAFMNWVKNFVENKMNWNESEKDLVREIKKNFSQRLGVQQAGAVKIGVGMHWNKYLKYVYKWLKYKRKYSLQYFSLIWGLMLIAKDSKNRINLNDHIT